MLTTRWTPPTPTIARSVVVGRQLDDLAGNAQAHQRTSCPPATSARDVIDSRTRSSPWTSSRSCPPQAAQAVTSSSATVAVVAAAAADLDRHLDDVDRAPRRPPRRSPISSNAWSKTVAVEPLERPPDVQAQGRHRPSRGARLDRLEDRLGHPELVHRRYIRPHLRR